jgi:streptogramin lyase
VTYGRAVGRAARWRFWLGAAALAAFFTGRANAVDPPGSETHFGHDAWDSDAGLPQNSVQEILQTRDGYFWLGTQEGLVRFDGVRFTVFDSRNTPALKDDWVQALCETRDGSLWIGTLTGLARRREGRFEAFGEGTPLERALIGSLIETRDGSLWVGSSAGLARVHNGELKVFTAQDGFPTERARSLYEDAPGNLWFGLPNGLARLSSGRFEAAHDPGGLSRHSARDRRRRREWTLGRHGPGLVHVVGDENRLYASAEGLTTTLARVLWHDRKGAVWVGTGNGLYRFRDGRFTRYSTASGLSSDRILSLYEDREGSLWIGTTDGGLNRLKSQRVVNYTRHEGLSDDRIWTVIEDRAGTLWVGTCGRKPRSDAAGTDRVRARRELRLDCARDRGRTARGTSGSEHRAAASCASARVGPIDSRRPTACPATGSRRSASTATARSGSAPSATGSPAIRTASSARTTSPTGFLPSRSSRSTRIAPATSGSARSAGGRRGCAGDRFETFSTREGLAHDIVISIYEDAEGTHWFATRGGLSRWRDGKFTTYRQKEGLFHDAVQRVVDDGRGYLWLTSNRGIFRVRQSGARLRGLRWRPDPSGALQHGERHALGGVQQRAARRLEGEGRPALVRDGQGPRHGRPVADRAQPHAPRGRGRGGLLRRGDLVETKDGLRTLPPGRTDLEFRYTAFNYSNPTSVRFRYRLEGLEPRWTDAGPRRTAYYTHVPPGSYRFRVMACNEDGIWNESGAAIPIQARAALLSDRMVPAPLGPRRRARGGRRSPPAGSQIEARQFFRSALAEAKLHALQAQLRPHFLANTLNSILALIGTDALRARRMVERLGELLRASLETDPGQIVTLDRELGVLELYLSIERMRFRDRLEIVLDVDPAVRDADVPSFLLQPVVENAIKHGLRGKSARGVVRIRATTEGKHLQLRIEDNGPGLASSTAVRPAGIGVRNTRQRLETLYPGRHLFELADAPEGGCVARIEIPLTTFAGGRGGSEERARPPGRRCVRVPAPSAETSGEPAPSARSRA